MIVKKKKRFFLVITSFFLQAILGAYLGHHYDMQVFYAVGHSVSKGMAPYGIFSPNDIFSIPNFYERIQGIGYPPSWGLFLGLLYLLIYEPSKNIFAYSLAIKIPSILSNVALAFVVERIAIQEGLKEKFTDGIFLFLLFNPFMIYISAIWGQFDSIAILTCVTALNILTKRRVIVSSLLMAISVSLKIIPLILLPTMLLYIRKSRDFNRFFFKFLLTFFIFLLSLTFMPFIIFRWDLSIILNNLDIHFNRAGCFTLFNIIDLIYDAQTLPNGFELLGYLWIPSLILGHLQLLRTKLVNRMDLFRWASSLIFILMLTRSWVSEQNIVFLIPLLMIDSIKDFKNWITIKFSLIVVLAFTFLNTSPLQMFFLISSKPMEYIKSFDMQFRIPRLFFKFIIVIPWQILGWMHVKETFKMKKAPS